MRINVFFFAELREIFGSFRPMDVRDGSTVEEVVALLAGESASFFSKKASLVYAVNESFETTEKKLSHDDELALMTPMSGG